MTTSTPSWQLQGLVRPRDDRVIAGVCSGIARRYGLSATTVRLLFVLSLLLPGPQFIIYIILWVLMPDEPWVGRPA
jgi:phage shock protein PspC (stress-responsive transcriptional regulator)